MRARHLVDAGNARLLHAHVGALFKMKNDQYRSKLYDKSVYMTEYE